MVRDARPGVQWPGIAHPGTGPFHLRHSSASETKLQPGSRKHAWKLVLLWQVLEDELSAVFDLVSEGLNVGVKPSECRSTGLAPGGGADGHFWLELASEFSNQGIKGFRSKLCFADGSQP